MASSSAGYGKVTLAWVKDSMALGWVVGHLKNKKVKNIMQYA